MTARYTASVAFKLEPEMLEELREIAKRERRSVGSVVRLMLEEMLREEQQDE